MLCLSETRGWLPIGSSLHEEKVMPHVCKGGGEGAGGALYRQQLTQGEGDAKRLEGEGGRRIGGRAFPQPQLAKEGVYFP